jgi:hypothetical protein
LGGESTPSRAIVQSRGHGYRIRWSILKREFALGGHLQRLALRYTQALITQMTQTAACNRHHTLDQQLCRWLLLSIDKRGCVKCFDGTGKPKPVFFQAAIYPPLCSIAYRGAAVPRTTIQRR